MAIQQSYTWTVSDGVARANIEEAEMVVSCEDEAFHVQLFEGGNEYCNAYIYMPYSFNVERFTQDWEPLELLDRIYDEMDDTGEGDRADGTIREGSSGTKLDKTLAFTVKAIVVTSKLVVFTTKVLYHAGRILLLTIDAIYTAIDQMQGKQSRRSRPRFTATEKNALYRKQRGYCNGCKQRFAARNLTVDHIKPLSQGGTERLTNLQLLCGTCNSVKGDRSQAQLKRRLREQGII